MSLQLLYFLKQKTAIEGFKTLIEYTISSKLHLNIKRNCGAGDPERFLKTFLCKRKFNRREVLVGTNRSHCRRADGH